MKPVGSGVQGAGQSARTYRTGYVSSTLLTRTSNGKITVDKSIVMLTWGWAGCCHRHQCRSLELRWVQWTSCCRTVRARSAIDRTHSITNPRSCFVQARCTQVSPLLKSVTSLFSRAPHSALRPSLQL